MVKIGLNRIKNFFVVNTSFPYKIFEYLSNIFEASSQVIPAPVFTGINSSRNPYVPQIQSWIPVFTGMTEI
jgi:hypothetical protein